MSGNAESPAPADAAACDEGAAFCTVPRLRVLDTRDATAIAGIDARAHPHHWSEAALRETLAVDAGIGALGPSTELLGFVLWRVAADEAEILEIAVDPAARRKGIARCLLHAALAAAAEAGATRCFLEVRESNAPARALYATEGFVQCGLRRGYYRNGDGREDALLLHRQLP